MLLCAPHRRGSFTAREALHFKINRSPIASIHVERHRRVVVDDAPSPTCLPKTHRRAVPHILILTPLTSAHSVGRCWEPRVAVDSEIDVARMDLDWPIPAGKPGCDAVAVHSAALQ